jgi:hypothetical protein
MDELTRHMARAARMARDEASNQEIANQLLASRRTIEYHHHEGSSSSSSRHTSIDRVLSAD